MNKVKVLHLTSGEDRHGGRVSIINMLMELKTIAEVELGVLAEGALTTEAEGKGLPVHRFIQKKRYDFSILPRIAGHIKSNGFEVLHCHGARANLFGSILQPFLKVPVITTVHSDYALDDFQGGRLYTTVFRLLNYLSIRRMDGYICVSKGLRKTLIERNFPLDKTYVSYNGIDMTPEVTMDRPDLMKKYGIPFDETLTYVGILGRLEPVKDHKTFLEGAGKALAQNDRLRFLIGGDGSELDRLKKLASELKITDKVHFLGHVNEPHEFFQLIDINCLTSISEGGVPYAVLEGAIYSRPTVASATGGMLEIIEKDTRGKLFEPEDAQGFADELLALISDEQRQKLGDALHQHGLENFSLESMGRRYLKIYEGYRTSSRKVFVIGYYGHFNLGDEAILHVIAASLRKILPGVRIQALSYQKRKTREYSDIEAISRNDLFGIIKALISMDTLVLGGGTLLQTLTSTRSLWYYLTFTFVGKVILHKQVMMLGNGFGPVDGRMSRGLTRYLLNRMDLILLRDQGSKEAIEQIGVQNRHIYVTTDFVYDFPMPEAMPSWGAKRIGINVRKWPESERLYQEVARLADRLTMDGHEICFMPFEHLDMEAIERVKAMMTQPTEAMVHSEDFQLLLGRITAFDAVISMRFHGMIFASISAIPFLGIAYDHKVHYLAREMDYPYVLGLDEFDADRAYGMVNEMVSDENRQRLRAYADQQKEKMKESKTIIRQYLND